MAGPLASASLLLIAPENRHHAVFRGQLELLDSFLFYFLFGGQIMFVSKYFELLLELLMLRVEGPQLLVMGQMLPNEFFSLDAPYALRAYRRRILVA